MTKSGPILSLIIPCYNEARNVAAMALELEKFKAVWPQTFEVILINDGSTDKTVTEIAKNPILQQLQKQDQLIMLENAQNLGKGAALKTGVAKSRGEYLLTLDADMATSPLELLNWLKLKGGKFSANEIWIGSREDAQANVDDKFIRRLAGRIFNYIIRSLTALSVKDSQCGFKLYPAGFAHKLFPELQTPGWAHDVELLLLAQKYKMKVVALPVNWQVKENSKINLFKDSVGMLAELLKIRKSI